MATDANERILVLGVGNPLMGDEGVGPRVVEYLLSRYRFPENVEVVDAGTMGFSILNLFQGADFVIVVDAVEGTGHEPGTVVSARPGVDGAESDHALSSRRTADRRARRREDSWGSTRRSRASASRSDEIVHWQLELTPVVEAAVPHAGQAVIDRLADRNVEIAQIDAADESDAEESAGESADRSLAADAGGHRTRPTLFDPCARRTTSASNHRCSRPSPCRIRRRPMT